MLGIFLDIETTGLSAEKHKVVEIAFRILDVSSGEELAVFHAVVKQSLEVWKLSDSESLKINGFSWKEIEKGRPQREIADEIVMLFKSLSIQRGKAVFICQNPSFDRAFFSQIIETQTQEKLLWPYHWLDLASMYWVDSIRKGKINPSLFPWEKGVSKDTIAKAYSLPAERKPHRAQNGVDHLILCYTAVVGFPLKTNK